MATSSEALLRQAEEAALPVVAMTAAPGRRLSHIRGVHGRRRAGEGDSFWQFRTYVPGDTASAIDWRRSARSDALYVREREWEAAQNLFFWCDGTASMDYASRAELPRKIVRARLIAMALAAVFVGGGERVGLLGGGAPPRAGRFGLRRLAEDILSPQTRQQTQSFVLPAGSHAVLVSDFLDPPQVTGEFLRTLARRGVSGHLIRVLDPAEEDFPFQGRTTFLGLEGEAPETLDRAEDLARRYRSRLAALHNELTNLSARLGWSFTTHRTDHPITPCLLAAAFRIAQQAGAG